MLIWVTGGKFADYLKFDERVGFWGDEDFYSEKNAHNLAREPPLVQNTRQEDRKCFFILKTRSQSALPLLA